MLPSVVLAIAMFNLTLVVAGLKELIIDEMGGTARDASLFFSIEMVAYILFAPLWGLWSDRTGRRKLFVVLGFSLTALCYFSYASVTDLGSLMALRFAQGAASVMGWSLLMAMVLDQPDIKKRGRYMGLMGGSLALGVSLGAPVGGLISRSGGARAPLEVAAYLFVLATLLSLFLRERPPERNRPRIGEVLTNLGRQPRLLLPYMFHFADRFTVGFFVVLFPLYLSSQGVDDPALRGRYLLTFLLPFAALQYFAGRLSEAVGPYRPLLLGSLLYGLLLGLVGFSDLQLLWPLMAVLGVLAAVMFPPSITLTAQLSDSTTRGSAMGGFNLAGSMGFAVGPLVGSWVMEQRGYGAAFVVSGALEIGIVLVAYLWLRQWGREGQA